MSPPSFRLFGHLFVPCFSRRQPRHKFGNVVRRSLLLALVSHGQRSIRCSVLGLCFATQKVQDLQFFSFRRAFARIIICCMLNIKPLAMAVLSPSSNASSMSPIPASPAGPVSSGAVGSSRGPGENLSISQAGSLRLFVLAQRSQRAGHHLVLFKSIGNI